MGSFKIIGGKKLRGEVIPQGAKNEALQQVVSEISLKRKRAMGEQVTMRERLEARRKAMMSWDEFKEKNLN